MSIKNEDEILKNILGDPSLKTSANERLCFYARINSIVDIKKELLEKTHEIDSNTFTDLANKYKQRIKYNTEKINEANCSEEFSRYSIDDFFKVLQYIQNKHRRKQAAKAVAETDTDFYILLDTGETELFIDEDLISLIIMIENYNNGIHPKKDRKR
jgi:hypothetical protein